VQFGNALNIAHHSTFGGFGPPSKKAKSLTGSNGVPTLGCRLIMIIRNTYMVILGTAARKGIPYTQE